MALMRDLGRARYVAAQGARVAWYMGQYMLARRLTGPFNRPGEPKFQPQAPEGDAKRIRAAFLDLFAQDRANIEAGLYPAPNDVRLTRAISALRNSANFFRDLPSVDQRRLERDGVEVREEVKGDGSFPAYYLQNFHYQTGGWLSQDSAKLYDTQVEILFGGAADAMRRIALGSLARALKGQDQRRVQLLDVASGNGRFLRQVLDAFPRIPATGLDLSPAYCAEARTRLAHWPQVEIVNGAIEQAPFDDASFDAVTCVYLFHELPPRVRRDAAREMARVLKPGGVLVLADSIQTGDTPDLDRMLEYFPVGFHEPYFSSYLKEDFAQMFGEVGLEVEETERAFLTKITRLRKR
ncbi:MAG TPA: methyltransferase domain-containing protein [Vitreimonas sp.]|uniref:class I SAM-dependent methyltransferase n=1 Tax=Vitreimonas sp. TaxID=3069702 RepID=UPI002D729EEB|nr:methyltransferase domain-containing protein [Vitreimonas sp.]HYD88008.1 methyltransferase domain-containing protein [Vitreimonas sp.]